MTAARVWEWIEPSPVEVSAELLALVDGQRLVAEIMARRGMGDVQAAHAFLDPELYQPASAYDLPNMARAVERVLLAVRQGQRVGVWGDFDVDGQTATTLLVTALRSLGLQPVYYIPSRQTEGHGLSTEGVAAFIAQYRPDLLITCDTGIAEHEAIALAQGRSVDVIVTDHHKLPETLPEAYACVNPQMLDPTHPLYTLPGVGCAYKLVEAVLAEVGREHEAQALLDLVALGIVADVAVVTGDTRYLLQCGLDVLRLTGRPGIQALCEVAGLDQTKISARDIGWTLGPRLNALGRLGDANEAVVLLSTSDMSQARILANRLEALNNQRKVIMEQVYQAALVQVEQNPGLLDHAALVLAHPEWPGGVLGIVANRLVEQFHRPVVLIATPDGETGKGSARSVEGVDITAAIASCSRWVEDHGGHTMAAGITIQSQHVGAFRRQLSQYLAALIPTERVPLVVDGYVPLDGINDALMRQLRRLEPHGPGNPTPVLVSRKVRVKAQQTMGRDAAHLRLRVMDGAGEVGEVVWWRWSGETDALPEGWFDLAFTLRESTFKGMTEVLAEYVGIRRLDDADVTKPAQPLIIIDQRGARNPHAMLRDVEANEHDVCVWCEGDGVDGVSTLRRDELRPASALIIWTTPPDPYTLQLALDTVRPERVYLFAQKPDDIRLGTFIQRIGGLVKFRLNQRGGEIRVDELAGLTAQSAVTVHKAVKWLAARGDVTIVAEEGDRLVLRAGGVPANSTLIKTLESQIMALLDESLAYRHYFSTADKTALFNRS